MSFNYAGLPGYDASGKFTGSAADALAISRWKPGDPKPGTPPVAQQPPVNKPGGKNVNTNPSIGQLSAMLGGVGFGPGYGSAVSYGSNPYGSGLGSGLGSSYRSSPLAPTYQKSANRIVAESKAASDMVDQIFSFIGDRSYSPGVSPKDTPNYIATQNALEKLARSGIDHKRSGGPGVTESKVGAGYAQPSYRDSADAMVMPKINFGALVNPAKGQVAEFSGPLYGSGSYLQSVKNPGKGWTPEEKFEVGPSVLTNRRQIGTDWMPISSSEEAQNKMATHPYYQPDFLRETLRYNLWNKDKHGKAFIDPTGGNCTAYAAARALETGYPMEAIVKGEPASNWVNVANKMDTVKVDHFPEIGTVVAWDNYLKPNDGGHAGFVEVIYPDGSFDMSHSGSTIKSRLGITAEVIRVYYDGSKYYKHNSFGGRDYFASPPAFIKPQ